VLLTDNHDIISLKLYDIDVGHKVMLINVFYLTDFMDFLIFSFLCCFLVLFLFLFLDDTD